jgi:hypothetical protein
MRPLIHCSLWIVTKSQKGKGTPCPSLREGLIVERRIRWIVTNLVGMTDYDQILIGMIASVLDNLPHDGAHTWLNK